MDVPTVQVYEHHARRWRDERPVRRLDAARRLARDAARLGDLPVADLGCGPGTACAELGPRVVALDAARGMLDLVADVAPGAWRVQASVDALPLRDRCLGGALAAKVLVHLPRAAVPLALADLHRALVVDAPVELEVFGGDLELGPLPGDDFLGRQFSSWPGDLLAAVLDGAGFEVERWDEVTSGDGLTSHRARLVRRRTLADTVGPGMRLLVCGLNPSLFAADVGVGFARPGNRFWPAALAAGVVSRDRDPRHALAHHGVGMTDLVKRATRRAGELQPDEFRHGVDRLARLCRWLRPGALCVVGLSGWRHAVDRTAVAGPQPRGLGDTPVYVMPNPSGINAHTTPGELAGHLEAAAALADAHLSGAGISRRERAGELPRPRRSRRSP